jgi:hypothetical protein
VQLCHSLLHKSARALHFISPGLFPSLSFGHDSFQSGHKISRANWLGGRYEGLATYLQLVE